MALQKETLDEHSGTIREHDRLLATLTERVDGVRSDLSRIELEMRDLVTRVRVSEERSSLSARDVERLEKRLDEFVSRRFEVGKLMLAALLGGLVSLVIGLAIRSLERTLGPIPAPSTSATPSGRTD